VTYTATRNTVARYGAATGAARVAAGAWLAPREQQETISDFLAFFHARGLHEMVTAVLQNRQRTSSRYGILKAEAVERVAQCLADAGVDTFQDFAALEQDPERQAALEAWTISSGGTNARRPLSPWCRRPSLASLADRPASRHAWLWHGRRMARPEEVRLRRWHRYEGRRPAVLQAVPCCHSASREGPGAESWLAGGPDLLER
jgi:hypothetical protein